MPSDPSLRRDPAVPSSAPTPVRTPRSVTALLQRLRDDDPTAPRLTWYGPDHARTGERIELSARVLSTWVAKTANLLEEEFEAGPGTVVALDLPTHWRTLVWQLAVWSTGAAVSLGAGTDGLDLVVTSSADAAAAAQAGGLDTVAVSLAPLAVSFGAPLAPGVLDYARVVTGYGDAHVPLAEPGPGDAALLVAGRRPLTHPDLLAAAATAAAELPPAVRLLTDATPADVASGPLAAYVRLGSIVLTPDAADVDERTRSAERLTAR